MDDLIRQIEGLNLHTRNLRDRIQGMDVNLDVRSVLRLSNFLDELAGVQAELVAIVRTIANKGGRV